MFVQDLKIQGLCHREDDLADRVTLIWGNQ